MSPDDANKEPAKPAAGAPTTAPASEPLEEGEKKGRLSFMKGGAGGLKKAGDSLGKVPGLNKVPSSFRLVLVILILIVLLAIVAVALGGGDEDSGPTGPQVVDPATLEDWSWSMDPLTEYMNEGQTREWYLSEILTQANGTIFIESIDISLTWQDEPDGRYGGRMRTNEPDVFTVGVMSGENISDQSPEMANDLSTKQGSIQYSYSFSSTNWTYMVVGNTTGVELPEDVFIGELSITATLVEAGDFTTSPALLIFLDNGNEYTIEVSFSGKILTSG